MAIICIECFNKKYKHNYTEREFVLRKKFLKCDVCGKKTHTINRFRRFKKLYDLKQIIKGNYKYFSKQK